MINNNKILEIGIKDDYIELYKVLKLANLVSSGGEAKFVISEGMVKVNNEVDTRKRRKTVAGETIEFEQQKIKIVKK